MNMIVINCYRKIKQIWDYQSIKRYVRSVSAG